MKRSKTMMAAFLAAMLAAGLALAGCTGGGGSGGGTPYLVSIAVTSQPTQTAYDQGDTDVDLDLTGMVVTGYYSDGSTKTEAWAPVDVSGFDSSAYGSSTLTVTVGGQSATFTVTIVVPAVAAGDFTSGSTVTDALTTGLATVPSLSGTAAVDAEADVNAALAAYNALTPLTKAESSVGTIKTQLDTLKAAIDGRRVDLFDTAHTAILTTPLASVNDGNKVAIQAAVDLALAEYNTLSPEARLLTQAVTDKAALDALQAEIDALGGAGVSKAVLITDIGDAETLILSVTAADTAPEVPSGTNYVTLAEQAAYQTAINNAVAVRDNASATQAQVDSAVGDLATATGVFTAAALKTGTYTGVIIIPGASITGLTAPVTGATPATGITVGDASYTVQSITWKQGGSTHTGAFAASTTYTADIVLQAAAGYKFSAVTPSVNTGTPAAGTISVDAAQNTLTFTVAFPATGAANQTGFAFSAGTTAAKTYGDTGVSYTATGGQSTGAVTYAVTSGNDVISVNSSTGAVTILKAGTAVITATKAGDATYNAATATLTLTVNRRTLTATAAATTRAYDGSTTVTVNITPTNKVGSDDVSITATGTLADADAGSGKAVTISGIALTGTDAANYTAPASIAGTTVNITKAAGGTVTTPSGTSSGTSSITVTAVSVSGGTGQTPEYAIDPSNTTEPTSGWQTGTAFSSLTNGNTYYVWARAAASTNYLAGTAVSSAAIAVGKATQAALNFGPTASVTYGAANPTYAATGGSGTGAVTYSVTTGADVISVVSGTGAVTIQKAGSAVITAEKAADATYNAATATLTLTVSPKALTGQAAATNRVYNGSTAVAVTITPAGVVGSDSVTITATGSIADADAGNTKTVTVSNIALTGTNAANYTAPASIANTTVNITKATGGTVTTPTGTPSGTSITVTAVSVNGGTGQTPEYAVSTSTTAPTSGWQTGTTFNSLVPDTYYVYARAGASTNYDVGAASRSAAIAVGKLAQTGFVFSAGSTASNTYGDANPTYTATGGSGTGGVTYAITGGDGAASVNASSGAVTILKAGSAVITATKAGDDDYNAATATLTLTVNKRTLTATALATNRVYNGTTAVTVTITPTNTVGSDVVTLTATGTANNADAGTGKTVTISNIALTGAQAANYTAPASIASTTVNITKATGGTVTTPTGTPSGTSITAAAVSVSGNTEQTPEYAVSTSTTAPTSGWQTTLVFNGLTAGSNYYVYARAGASTNYDAGAASRSASTIAVGKLAQTGFVFSAGTTASNTYGDTGVSYTATGGQSSATPTYAVTSGSDVISVVSGTGAVTILKAGSAVITATKAADATYNAATATLSLTVAKAAITPVVTIGSVTLPAAPNPSVTGASNPGSGTPTYQYSNTAGSGYTATVPSTRGAWYVKATVPATTNYEAGTSAEESFTISAVVTYNNEGATSTATVTPPASTVVNLPAAPTRSGYDFGGWFTSTGGLGTAFNATTTVTTNITVYAKWIQRGTGNVTVTYVGPAENAITVNGPANTLSRLANNSFTFTASSSVKWRVNGGAETTGTQKTVNARDYTPGTYEVLVIATIGGRDYSSTVTFTVGN